MVEVMVNNFAEKLKAQKNCFVLNRVVPVFYYNIYNRNSSHPKISQSCKHEIVEIKNTYCGS